MANPEHVEIVKQGRKAIWKWRQNNPHVVFDLKHAPLSNVQLTRANLSGADLFEAHLDGAILKSADLSRARLAGANLMKANLGRVNLTDSSLFSANLPEANLKRANLSGANLTGTDLREADLTEANLFMAQMNMTGLRGADLTGATCGYTVWGDLNLSSANGLETIKHPAPSIVGVGTLYLSKGTIPEEFLRGCGLDPKVQPILLGDKQALTDAAYAADGTAIRPQTCFISYSSQDKTFVDQLQKALNASGVDYWYAPEHGIWGRPLKEQIDQQIAIRDRVVLVCSKSSLNESDWVLHEITRALETENQRKAEGVENWRVLFPVMVDDELLHWNNHLQPRVLEVLAGDFRGAMKGNAFESAFKKLLKGLQTEGSPNREA